MKIKQMMKDLKCDEKSMAEKGGITVLNLRTKISSDTKVEKLASGDYVTVRKDAVYFKGDSDEQLKHKE